MYIYISIYISSFRERGGDKERQMMGRYKDWQEMDRVSVQWFSDYKLSTCSDLWASQVALGNPPASAGDVRDMGLIPGLGRSPGGGHGNPLQYSCLKNLMDRGSWWATVHRVARSWTQLKWLSTHARTFMPQNPDNLSCEALSYPPTPSKRANLPLLCYFWTFKRYIHSLNVILVDVPSPLRKVPWARLLI